MEGASNLLGLDLHLTREKMRELFHALEEKQRLMELLDPFLEQPPGELAVRVGLEEAHPSMKDLALIGMTIRMASGLPAKVAVLGPMRMNYERVIAAALQISRALEILSFKNWKSRRRKQSEKAVDTQTLKKIPRTCCLRTDPSDSILKASSRVSAALYR
jgi:heat-inducible transcriptional repressor